MHVQMLLTDGFGGFGGISRFNRDFLSALNVCPSVERVYALPRLIPEPIEETIPEAVVYERRAARGRASYALAVMRRALRGPRTDLVICGHINLLPLAWIAARLARARLVLVIHGYEAWAPSSHRLSNLLVKRDRHFYRGQPLFGGTVCTVVGCSKSAGIHSPELCKPRSIPTARTRFSACQSVRTSIRDCHAHGGAFGDW